MSEPQTKAPEPQEAQKRNPVAKVLDMAKSAVDAALADGTIKAAARQGADELGAALKAFPDSIQESELGTVFNPTAVEMQRDRESHSR